MALTGITISDFNPDNFNALLSNGVELPAIKMISVPFGQVQQMLMDANAEYWEQSLDFIMVWTQPQAVLPEFGRALRFEKVSTQELMAEVDQFCLHLLSLKGRVNSVFVPAWVQPPFERGLGVADLGDPRGIANLLMRINLRLIEQLQGKPGIYILNAALWLQSAGPQAFNAKLWYMAKVAFSNKVLKQAASDVKVALNAVAGGAKKLLVLDLDNTLWGGVVGDVGWQGLSLGGHDPVGEAFVEFQRALKALRSRGFVLALASKNEESVAIEAIDNHPEMVLRKDDFSAWRINWNDKAQNIVEIVSELNLGINSVVFIDDNPAERARVAETLREVMVPEWPADPLAFRAALADLSCFDSLTLSDEDLQRAEMYQVERQRNAEKLSLRSLDEWLKTLEMKVRVEPLSSKNLPRVAQLLNKSNQMNLQTRRLAESEFQIWSELTGRRVWAFYVDDKFGFQGLTGVLSVEKNGRRLNIVDFILSCRVMGRKVEHAMLTVAFKHALEHDCTGVDAQYLETKKNIPCLKFFKGSALRCGDETKIFHWESIDDFFVPKHITLEHIE